MFVDYFFQYRNDIFATILNIDTTFNKFTDNFAGIKKLENKNYFDMFKIGYLTQEKTIIDTKNIICKCLSIDIKNEKDFFYLSDFTNENEHD